VAQHTLTHQFGCLGKLRRYRKSGIEQATQHRGTADKSRAFVATPAVLREGLVVYDGANPKNPRGRLFVVSGLMNIHEIGFDVTAGFREHANKRLFCEHALKDVKRAERQLSQRGESLSSNHPPAVGSL
jgi:hypothetical protein